jgi:hypothetical protein
MSDGVYILFDFNIVLQTQRDAFYQDYLLSVVRKILCVIYVCMSCSGT